MDVLAVDRRMDISIDDLVDDGDRLERAGRAEGMADHGFRGLDQREFVEGKFESLDPAADFARVRARRGQMAVDQRYPFGINAAVLENLTDAARDAVRIWER